MDRRLSLAVLVLAAALPAAAQQVSAPSSGVATLEGLGPTPQAASPSITVIETTLVPGQPSTIHTFTLPASCPVSMRAEQGSGSSLLKVRGPQPLPGPAQHIRLLLEPLSEGRQLTSARIRVRGFSVEGRPRLAAAFPPAPNRTQTLTVSLAEQEGPGVAADLTLPGFSSVQSIDLLALTYANGDTWKLESRNRCSVAPDPLMLVGAR